MNVLNINTVCGTGSTGRIATDIYRVLDKQGHRCVIAYGRGDSPDDINSIKIGDKLDMYLHVAKTRVFDTHGFGSSKATKELIEKIRCLDFDVIHLHNIHGYYIDVEILFEYLKDINIPVVWTLHDCWPFTGHCTYFDYVGCEKWKNTCYACPQKKSYPKSWLANNSKANYIRKKTAFLDVKNMTIVTPSKWLSDLVKQSYLKSYDVKVINNGIDLNVFKPSVGTGFRKRYKLADKFIILGVANVWTQMKGFDIFNKLSMGLDDNSRIVLVGLSDKQISKLPSNIIGIQRTNSIEELAEIYSAADVFVNPTFEDNFPTTNVEALACGTPVITFNTGGSVESVSHDCGMIVEKGNIPELANKINQIKVNTEIDYTANCANRAEKLYNKNDKFDEYVKLYLQLSGNMG